MNFFQNYYLFAYIKTKKTIVYYTPHTICKEHKLQKNKFKLQSQNYTRKLLSGKKSKLKVIISQFHYNIEF